MPRGTVVIREGRAGGRSERTSRKKKKSGVLALLVEKLEKPKVSIMISVNQGAVTDLRAIDRSLWRIRFAKEFCCGGRKPTTYHKWSREKRGGNGWRKAGLKLQPITQTGQERVSHNILEIPAWGEKKKREKTGRLRSDRRCEDERVNAQKTGGKG